jgi:hypothetical protein
LAALSSVAVATVVLAANYAFVAASGGLKCAGRGLQQDQIAEFECANAATSLNLRYNTPLSLAYSFRRDTVYIVYADGQIAEFEQVSATDTIRLRFKKKVPSLPPGVKVYMNLPAGAVSGSSGGEGFNFERIDFADSLDIWFSQREKIGSVTVTQYSYPMPAGCSGTVSCPNPARAPSAMD